jgi:hypothetical protein
MFSRQEHFADDQVICWNCEETVHQTAIVCPYCHVEIHRHHVQKAADSAKITTLSPSPNVSESKVHLADRVEGPLQTVRFLCSLLLLLAGSALFFISMLIALFSKGGTFTLSWPEQSWSAYFGLGIALLAFGTLFLQKVSGSADD